MRFSGSNRPFAHCCQIFTERKFLVAFSLFQKSNGIFNFFFCSTSLGYKHSIAKNVDFVKSFLIQRLNLSISHYTTIKAYFLKFVKFFLFLLQTALLTALVIITKHLIFFVPLGYSSRSWPLRTEGIRLNLYIYVNCKTNLIGLAQSIGCLF